MSKTQIYIDMDMSQAIQLVTTRFAFQQQKAILKNTLKDIAKPIDERVRSLHKSTLKSYGRGGRKIAYPPIRYKSVVADKQDGSPALFFRPYNNGAVWFNTGTNKRYTKRGGYYRGSIKPLGLFDKGLKEAGGSIKGRLQDALVKAMNKAIKSALRKNVKTINTAKGL